MTSVPIPMNDAELMRGGANRPWCMHRSQVLPLWQAALHCDSQLDLLSSSYCLSANHIEFNIDVWVAIADTRHICKLRVAHLQQLSSLVLLWTSQIFGAVLLHPYLWQQ